METTYFQTCQTFDQAKSEYRRLAMLHHPDRGGDTPTMQAVNAAWAAWQAAYTRTTERARQQQAHAEGKRTAADYHDIDELAATLEKLILALLNMGLSVEMCGLWLWVTGDTKAHKEELKALGLRWSPSKVAWYFAGVPSYNRKHRTMEEIRARHGSQRYAPQPDEEAQ